MLHFPGGKSCDAFVQPAFFLFGKSRKKWCDPVSSRSKTCLICYGTNNSGLNSTYLLISKERQERQRRERPKGRINSRRASEEDRRREVSMLHLETC